MTQSSDDPFAHVRALTDLQVKQTNQIRDTLSNLGKRILESLGGLDVYMMSDTVDLEYYGDVDKVYGHLFFNEGELRVAYRTREDDLNDYYSHSEDDKAYEIRSIEKCSFKWLTVLSQEKVITSLLKDLIENLDSQRKTGEAALQVLEKTLQSPVKDASVALEDVARELGLDDVIVGWRGAQAALYVDPAEAVTRGCSLVESVCKHISEKATGSPLVGDIQTVYKAAAKVLQLSPDRSMAVDLRQMLSGVNTVVSGIGSFRTHCGSAHGRGPEAQMPTLAQARLLLNLAGTVSTFMMETFKNQPQPATPPQQSAPTPNPPTSHNAGK